MPIGYLVVTGGLAVVAWSAVLRHRPRRPSPFRLSYVFGLWLNWPLVVLLVLFASTALAVDQSGADSPGVWTGLGFAGLASAGLAVLRRRGQETGAVVEGASNEGLGADWRDHVDSELAARLGRHARLARMRFVPASVRRRGVERIANLRYGPAGRGNLLDLYRHRSHPERSPTLVYLHARMAGKRLGARRLLNRLAGRGWVCNSANYRSTGDFSDSLLDVDDARGFVEQLRATSSNPVVYAEPPAAQHGFDLFRSRRLDTVIDAIEAFTARVGSRRRAAEAVAGA